MWTSWCLQHENAAVVVSRNTKLRQTERPWIKPARNKFHKFSHFATQCRTKALRRNGLRQLKIQDLGDGHLHSNHAIRGFGLAARVPVLVQEPNGSDKLNVLPDSGADIKQLGEDVDNLFPLQESNAYSVDGSCLRCVGQMTIQITLGEITISETLHIFPTIPGGMLISWKTAQKLLILPGSYPTQISATMSKTSVTAEDFFREFPSVFDG